MNKKLLVAAISTLLAPATTFAKDSLELEEVVVTAQRTTQNLQDVPISMSVVSSEDLNNNSIFNFSETVQLTPGVTVNAQNPASAAIKIRGVGPSSLAAGASQSVTVFVDEVAASQIGAVFSTMVDVAQVEVLRGPQGTLYGRNSPSGAYNISTVAPSFQGVEGYVDGTYSQWDNNNEPTVDLRGAINFPILDDKVALRIAGVYADTEGGIKMGSPTAQEDATGGKEHESIRARLVWQISDDSSLNWTTNYKDLVDTFSTATYDGLVPGTGGTNPVAAIFSEFDDKTDYGTERSFSETNVKDTALRYNWSGDLTNIVAILSYQEFESSFLQNQTPHPVLVPSTVDFFTETEQASFELRASDSLDAFDYVAGIYVIDRKGGGGSNILVGGIAVLTETNFKAESQAVFTNTTFHVTQKWDVGVGLRYEDATLEQVSDVVLIGTPFISQNERDVDNVSWSLKVNYFSSDNMTVYFAADNAYRQGGFNSFAPAVLAFGQILNIPEVIEIGARSLAFDNEDATAFEIGVKGITLDGRLRYNVAIFHQEFDNHISNSLLSNAPALVDSFTAPIIALDRTNIDEVLSQGIEFDITYLASKHWTVNFRAAYTDATIEKWDDKLCSIGTDDDSGGALICPSDSGSALSSDPKLNTNLQLGYNTSLAGDWELFSNLSWNWKDSSDGDGDTDEFNDPINLINLTVGVSDERFTVKIWGKNLIDEHQNQLPFTTENGDAALSAALTGVATPGREYGVSLGYRF